MKTNYSVSKHKSQKNIIGHKKTKSINREANKKKILNMENYEQQIHILMLSKYMAMSTMNYIDEESKDCEIREEAEKKRVKTMNRNRVKLGPNLLKRKLSRNMSNKRNTHINIRPFYIDDVNNHRKNSSSLNAPSNC